MPRGRRGGGPPRRARSKRSTPDDSINQLEKANGQRHAFFGHAADRIYREFGVTVGDVRKLVKPRWCTKGRRNRALKRRGIYDAKAYETVYRDIGIRVGRLHKGVLEPPAPSKAAEVAAHNAARILHDFELAQRTAGDTSSADHHIGIVRRMATVFDEIADARVECGRDHHAYNERLREIRQRHGLPVDSQYFLEIGKHG